MATSSQAAPAPTAAVCGGRTTTTTTTSQTIAGVHVFKIDNFSATKDLGVGMSIKSSPFLIGGHGWYIECYPWGVDENSGGSVSVYLCRQDDQLCSRVSAECKFTLMESLKLVEAYKETVRHPDTHSRWGIADFIDREGLESFLKDDCFHVRCTVCVWIDKFAAVPQWDQLATETVAGSHVLTIDDYSKTREVLALGDTIDSCTFHVGGHWWRIKLFPCGEDEDDSDGIAIYLCLDDDPVENDEVKVRLEITLLTDAGQKISSIQDFYTFKEEYNAYGCKFLRTMEHESLPLLQGSIHIRFDMAVVEGITVTPNASVTVRVGGDVTFEVGGHLFPAHKCVLATRCTAFMAEFSSQAGKDNADVANQPVVRVVDMEPRVFDALLHFIYTDALPEVSEDDRVLMAQGLLVAADRYAMERLKLICADMLCNYMNDDARSAVDTLDLAVKHGCRRLMEKCMELLKGHFTKVTP